MDKVEFKAEQNVVGSVFFNADFFVRAGAVVARCLSYRGAREDCHRTGGLVLLSDGKIGLRETKISGCAGCSNDGTR